MTICLIINNKKYIIFGVVKVAILCFKQLLLDMKQKFGFSYHLIDGEKLLSVVIGVPTFLTDKPLDFHNKTFSVSPNLFKA